MHYQKLPGKKKGLLKSYSLWLGQDHLLAVESLYTEEYKRYDFKDIQGFVIRETATGRIVNLFYGGLVLTTGLLCMTRFTTGAPGSGWAWGVVTAVFVLLLGLNIYKGKTCTTHLQTDLAVHRLPSLDRSQKAGRLIGTVRPLIGRVQGALTREQIEARTRTDMPKIEPSDMPQDNEWAAGPLSTYRGGAHWALFGMVLVGAAASAFHFLAPGKPGYFLKITANVGVILLCIIALGMQSGSRLPRSVRIVPIAALVTVVVTFIVTYFYSLVQSVSDLAQQLSSEFNQYTMPSSIIPAEHGFLTAVYFISIALMLVYGAAGLYEMAQWKRESGSQRSTRHERAA